jgi:hypothetical protein
MDDLGAGKVGVNTAIFIYFIKAAPAWLRLIAPLFDQVDRGRRELVTSAVTLLEARDQLQPRCTTARVDGCPHTGGAATHRGARRRLLDIRHQRPGTAGSCRSAYPAAHILRCMIARALTLPCVCGG